jgi:PRC-barrel domain protein
MAMERNYPRDLSRLDDLTDYEIPGTNRNLKDWDVYGYDDEKIGSIKYLIGSPSDRKAHLAIVDAGGVFTDRLIAIPLSYFQFRRDDKERVDVPFTKDQIKNAPQYRENEGNFIPVFEYWANIPSTTTRK